MLALSDPLALTHQNARTVQEGAVEPLPVVDDEQLPFERVILDRQHHHAIRRRDEGRAGRLRDVEAGMVAARFAPIDTLRSEAAGNPPPHRPDEILSPAFSPRALLAREIDGFQFWIAPRHEGLRSAAGRARDIHALDIPVARRDCDRAGDHAPVGQSGSELRLRPRIAIECSEEAPLLVEDQLLIVELGRHRIARRRAANPAALRQFAVEGEDRSAGGLRRRRWRWRRGRFRRRRGRDPHRLDRLGNGRSTFVRHAPGQRNRSNRSRKRPAPTQSDGHDPHRLVIRPPSAWSPFRRWHRLPDGGRSNSAALPAGSPVR